VSKSWICTRCGNTNRIRTAPCRKCGKVFKQGTDGCTYKSVTSCRGDDICFLIERALGGKIYIVRGSEMFCLELPPLPPPDPFVGTGTERIEQMLGGTRD